METIIKISGKEVKLKSSAYTIFAYQNEFNRDLLEDVAKMQKIAKDIKSLDKTLPNYGEQCLNLIMPIIKVVMQLLYMTAKEANDSITNYQTFLKSIDNLFEDFSWFQGVLECSLAPFKGRVQNSW